jgi:membrane fusion protein (multidrug efflux system)
VSNAFTRTTRSLQADGFRRDLVWIGLAAVTLGLWSAWFFGARVRVFAMSTTARLEVEQAVHPVEALVEGRVIRTTLELGRAVETGEVLVALDSRDLELELAEARAHAAGLADQLRVLDREIAAEEQVLREEQGMTSLALAEAKAQTSEAEAEARFALEKASRWKTLAKGGVVSGVDGLAAEAQSQVQSERVRALVLGSQRLKQERRTRISTQTALLGRLAREQAELRATFATDEAAIDRLANELERHLIRAPVAGRLGEVASLRVGGVVEAGERLASVVPEGRVSAVAFVSPAEAAGRIRPGQPARLRMDGVPWTQYGSLRARVRSVASEPRGGEVRVELALARRGVGGSAIPLEHGLPGVAEIEVERATPAELVLRAAGRLVAAPRRPRPTQDGGPR